MLFLLSVMVIPPFFLKLKYIVTYLFMGGLVLVGVLLFAFALLSLSLITISNVLLYPFVCNYVSYIVYYEFLYEYIVGFSNGRYVSRSCVLLPLPLRNKV